MNVTNDAAMPNLSRDWLNGVDLGIPELASARIPVAVVARTSTDDQQDPVKSILRRFRVSTKASPPPCVNVSTFYDAVLEPETPPAERLTGLLNDETT